MWRRIPSVPETSLRAPRDHSSDRVFSEITHVLGVDGVYTVSQVDRSQPVVAVIVVEKNIIGFGMYVHRDRYGTAGIGKS